MFYSLTVKFTRLDIIFWFMLFNEKCISCVQIEDRLIRGAISYRIDLLLKSRVTSILPYSYKARDCLPSMHELFLQQYIRF